MGLKKSELTRYLKLDERRLKLNRQAKALEREMELIEPKIYEAVRTQGTKGVLSKWGYNLMIKLLRSAVKWKDEFIRLAGAEKAQTLSDAAPLDRESLVIEKAA